MFTWEYCYIRGGTLSLHSVDGEVKVTLQADETKGDKSVREAVSRKIAELGNTGWELVNVYDVNLEDAYYFKRRHLSPQARDALTLMDYCI